jgi:subtilase family protein
MDVWSRKLLRIFAAALLAGAAHAQVTDLDIPDMPTAPVSVPGITRAGGGVVSGVTDSADLTLRRLSGLRELRIDQLARGHREELDRDPAGELVIRAEVVAIDISDAALERALAHKFLLKRTRELPELAVKISILQTPEGWSAKRGLKELRALDPQGVYDFNHVYLEGGDVNGAPAVPAAAAQGPRGNGRVGLIDGGVDTAHQVFQQLPFERFGCNGAVVPNAHGTAVAAILATHLAVQKIYAADVYCGLPTGGAVDAVAAAFSWLARERVGVINVSLVGPRNALLERIVGILVQHGFLIVAAVGNDGPSAPPLYPASYPGVVGVTAVDSRHRVLVEACRGEQVDFAALGADMKAATQAPDVYAPVRGTSFAAPIVAALMAADFSAPDVAERDRVIAKWTQAANDLGKRGREDVYGAGELGDLPAAAAAASQANK